MKNVVLVTLDATRKDVFGIYGNTRGLTPFIDSLKDDCLIFTKAQSVGPYTQAAFPGLLTSSYYLDYGKPEELSPKRTLISEPLQKAGIVTAAFHANPYVCGMLGWNRGWDIFYDSMQDEVGSRIPYIRGNVINSKVSSWLEWHAKNGGGKPFFLWFHYMDVHEPYMPEQKYIDMVDPSITLSQDAMYSLFTEILLKRDISDTSKVDILKNLYDIHVREVDNYVQDIFGVLDKLALLNNSIIIITSDHGDEFNEHGGLSHDDKLYSELINIPLIIHGTGKNQVYDTLVSSVDIPPTILRLFGLNPVEQFRGHALLPIERYPERGVYGEALNQKSQRGGDISKDAYFYREGDLKIIYRANLDTWELYDLKEDTGEQHNIVDTATNAENLKNKLRPVVRRWLNA